jgi:hypothetical protein
MGLYPQPNKWQCGPFALKHALIMLGKFIDEKDVSRIAGTHWWAGTDEVKLARAARKYDCSMKMVRRTNALRAKRELLLALKRGYPCLLCVDGWSHWITIVGAERGKFIYIDSSTAPVVRVEEWRALKRRWVYREVDSDDPSETKTLFDLHPLIPQFRMRTHARFSLKRARFLRRPENRAFATYWDEYFTDLVAICTPRTPRSSNVIPMGAFLRRHGAMISKQVAFWHGGVTPQRLDRVLRNFRFVADTYDLVIRAGDEKRAIAALSSNLSLWASAKYGVDPVFGEG